MRNIRTIFLLAAFLFSGAGVCRAQMTDDAIKSYAAQALAAGKSQAQIGSELLARGVSASQVKRLLSEYQSSSLSSQSYIPVATQKLDEVRPTRNVASEAAAERTDAAAGKKNASMRAENETESSASEKEKKIFGHDIFSNEFLSFEPNVNAATPQDYVLGPGDEIVIDIWGENEATVRQTISPEGRIIVSQVGAIDLSGLTIEQATKKIKTQMGRRYAGVQGAGSQISVTLGRLRTIQVNVMGEVKTPGTYRLSSFSSVFNALYRAGGVTLTGSLRNVQVVRAGENIATVDIYSYIFNGSLDQNVSLKEGDVIIVPPYDRLVDVRGGIKRPMLYELRGGETVSDVLAYAGGFTADAYAEEVTVDRFDGNQKRVINVPADRFGEWTMEDGDSLRVAVNSHEKEIYANKVEVRGAVYRPGAFALGGDILTVGQLVSHAGGLLEDAFLNRAQLIREQADRSLEILALPLGAIVAGTADDVLLRRGDILVVSNVKEIEPKGDLTITGYVISPGKYEFAENMTVEDLILLAGGLGDGASAVNVEVSRRLEDPMSTEAPDKIAEVFSFSIKDGLIVDGEPQFLLCPYDVVSVRRSPVYIEQKNVSVTGEVTFPGQYTLTSNNYRLSELVNRAGGATKNANIHGAMLRRQISQYERNVRTGISKVVSQAAEADSMSTDKLKVSEIYTVGVELDKALAHPGSDYDMILRDGDELIIPENTTTVRVQGEVMYPNTVHYISGKSVRYYVHQSGGFSNSARVGKTYVLYMNGTMATGALAKVEPGCEIIVPKRRERQRMTASEIFSIGSSAASIAAVVATIVNIVNSNKE